VIIVASVAISDGIRSSATTSPFTKLMATPAASIVGTTHQVAPSLLLRSMEAATTVRVTVELTERPKPPEVSMHTRPAARMQSGAARRRKFL
jgi:hypothetical protein